jgi:hypothetical protein
MTADPVPLEVVLFGLQPRAKIYVGLGLAVGGGAACVLFWQDGWIVWSMVFAAIVGPALALTGWRELARQRAVDAEISRARAEWRELADGIRSVRRERGNVARWLQERGYREFAVRRWITAELDPGARQ